MNKKLYEQELFRLQAELVEMQGGAIHRARLVVIFEGRDAAGRAARSSGSRST